MTAERIPQEPILTNHTGDVEGNIGPRLYVAESFNPRNTLEPRPSKGARKHIRDLKSQGQTGEAKAFQSQSIEAKRRVQELKAKDEERLKTLNDILEAPELLPPIESAEYYTEKFFLELKLEKRGWDEHRRVLAGYLDNLPPEITDYLDGKIPDGKGGDTSRLLQIRDRVISKDQLNRLMSQK